MRWIKKNNHGAMKKVLKNCEKIAKKENLDFERIYTYDNDFFSKDYFIGLLKDEVIFFNERLGEEPDKSDDEIETITHAYAVKPWYYKDKGAIMNKGFLADVFKVKNDDVIYNKFPKTKELLKMEKYWVHADWSGNYFLGLAALTGSKFHEITYTIEETNNIREWVLKEKPKGVVISCVGSDKKFPLTDMSFGPILDMFDIPELKYLKLLFVSKRKEGLIDEGGNSIMEEKYDGNVEWVIAYVK